MVSNHLDTLRTKMVAAARARFAAYETRDAAIIGSAESLSEAADRAYHLEYARCVASVSATDRALASAHLADHIDTLRSMRAAA